MIRLPFFLIDGYFIIDVLQVMGGEPLLKLLAVDWFKVDSAMDKVALHPKCLVQVNQSFKSEL